MVTIEVLEDRIKDFMEALFNADEETINIKTIGVNADFIEEIGLDSLEAFETVIALHEFLDVEIPEDIDIESVSSLHNIANYILTTYDQETIESFLEKDLTELIEMRKEDDIDI